MGKHRQHQQARSQLLGGPGAWTVVTAVTLLFWLSMIVTSCQQNARAEEDLAERRQEANTTTAAAECERNFLDRAQPQDYDLTRTEAYETSGFHFTVVLHYTYTQDESPARIPAAAACTLSHGGWKGWNLRGHEGF